MLKHQVLDIINKHITAHSSQRIEALADELVELIEGIAEATGEAMLDNVSYDAERASVISDPVVQSIVSKLYD